MRTGKALIAGTLAYDVTPVFPDAISKKDLLIEGRNVYLDAVEFRLGGLVANTGVAMHRLGADIILASRVGDNPLGRVVEEMLRGHCPGAPCTIDRTKEQDTSATVVVTVKNSDRIFWHHPGASQDYRFENLPADGLARADLLHFGYPTGMPFVVRDGGERLRGMLRRAKETGITVSLDTSLPALDSESGRADWRSILAKLLPHVDVFAPSIEETMLMLRRDEYLDVLARAGEGSKIEHIDLAVLDKLAGEILSHGVKVCAVKLGKYGMFLRTAGGEAFAGFGRARDCLPASWFGRELLDPAYAVDPIHSTNGAGDTAMAGFLAGMLDGMPPDECLRLAMGAAAFRIGSPLGADGIPHRDDVLERIGRGWEKDAVGSLPDTWRWNGAERMFVGANDASRR